mmetsp:Transcript_12287/g.32633  ORF Transcript_12287/g.32633 Transcript_12287/m.32633 type:complete len:474 (-) Transcript_12287:433-1854(-)
MQAEADEHRHDQVRVHPRRHLQQTSIFAKRVQRVEHLDRHENAQRQRARLRLSHGKVLAWRAERHATSTRGAVRKAGAESLPRLALTPRHQLLHRDGRVAVAAQVDAHEVRGRVPCRKRAHRREADVHANNHVAEEHPRRDQAVVGTTRGLAHDVQVRRVESERRGGWAVGDQINPQQLHGNETLWESKRRGDEDGSNLADVAADHVADESLHVVVDRSSLRHRGDDRVEVVVRKHHVARLLRHLRARDTHCHANVREFECGRVVHAVARHRRHLALVLQQLDDVLLVLRLRAAEHAPTVVAHQHRNLLVTRKVDKLAARQAVVRPDLLPLFENANLLRDRLRSQLVVAGDDNDANASLVALRDRTLHLLARRVDQTCEAAQNEVALHSLVSRNVLQNLVSLVLVAAIVLLEVAEARSRLVRKRERTQRVARHILNSLADFALRLRRQRHLLARRREHLRAPINDALCGTLDV